MNENNVHNDTENLNFLKGVSKNNNFKVPAGYFEELASKMETNLEIKDGTSPRRGIVKVMVINLAIAAAVIIGVFVFKPSKPVPEEVALVAQEVLVSDFISGMIEDVDVFDPLSDIGIQIDYQNEIAMLTTAIDNFPVEEVTAEDISSIFEEEWEDEDYYEF